MEDYPIGLPIAQSRDKLSSIALFTPSMAMTVPLTYGQVPDVLPVIFVFLERTENLVHRQCPNSVFISCTFRDLDIRIGNIHVDRFRVRFRIKCDVSVLYRFT